MKIGRSVCRLSLPSCAPRNVAYESAVIRGILVVSRLVR
jgi:hypothetical protein